MSETNAALESPWRPFATAAYFLAGLVVLAPGIGFVFAAWPPNPSLLSWRHISSNILVAATPMIGAAAVGILLAAKVRGDMRVLKLLRQWGLIALILGVPFSILYAVDSTLIYHGIPAQQTRSLVRMESRMYTVMAIGLGLIWMFVRVARGGNGTDALPEGPGEKARCD